MHISHINESNISKFDQIYKKITNIYDVISIIRLVVEYTFTTKLLRDTNIDIILYIFSQILKEK